MLAALTVGLGFIVPVAQLLVWSWQVRASLPEVGEAAWNTLLLALMAAAGVLALSLAFALLGRRSGGDRGVHAAGFAAGLGYAVPGTVLAVGAMWLLVAAERAAPWLAGLALSSSLVGVLMALCVRFFRVGHEATESAFLSLRPSLLESARLLGVPARERLRRIVLPKHRFASVHAGAAGGEFVTRPFTFAGDRLLLNYATSAAGSVQVELQDAAGKPLAGFALADMPPLYGDELDATAIWKSADVSLLAGKPVRLRFVLKDADVYALRFANGDSSQ